MEICRFVRDRRAAAADSRLLLTRPWAPIYGFNVALSMMTHVYRNDLYDTNWKEWVPSQLGTLLPY